MIRLRRTLAFCRSAAPCVFRIFSMLPFLLPVPAAAEYRVEIDAPKLLKPLLEEFLDVSRHKDRDDLNADQLNLMLARTPDQVARLAATEGFFSVATEVDTAQEDGDTVVRVRVEAGPRTVVDAVSVEVTGAAPERSPEQVSEVHRAWTLTEGEPFRQEEWSAAKQNGLQVLQRRRYAAAEIARSEARIDADRQAAALSVLYDSGPVFTLGELNISGTERYPASIVRNLNPLRVGEEYSADRLLEFQRQLLRTPYFSNAVIDLERDPSHAALAPVNVRVTEFPEQRVRAGVGFTTDTGAQLEGRYSHNNLFGRAWVLEAQTVVEQRRQLAALGLAKPPGRRGFVDDVHGSFERTTLEGVDLRSWRFGAARTRHTERRDLAYSIEYYRDELELLSGATLPPDTIVRPGAHRALVFGITQTRRQVDNEAFPRDGRVVTLQAGVAVKGLLTDQTFIRGYGQAREYLPIGRRDLVILRAELGAVITKGGNASIPASLLFRAGGTDSVRGYAFRSIGNERDGTVYPTRFLATGSVEYQHWLSEQWGGAVFYDVGVATDRWSDRQLFHAVGVGARWRSPVGRVNLDLAYGIRDGSVRPHLSLGVAF
ncbi:MAG TPA: autotransporter assembly complex family protein [Noviherbaspirillum sp.]